MLSVQIKKQLDNFLLDVSFETENETMALLGASGCGKSMTLKCIAGIVRPDSGKIVLNDRVLFDSKAHINLTPQQRRVGYLFQQYALFPNMTVAQNIAAGCRERDKQEKKRRVAEKIRAMRLDGLEQKRPYQLSGGQQQRVALARILINEPELLLLDEPFTALDSYLKWQLELELADTLKSFERGTLFVSHSRDEVYRLCESVCVLTGGHSEGKQSVKALFNEPRTLAAAELSGCKNFSRIKPLSDDRIQALDWGVSLRAARPQPNASFAGIRAHYIRLSRTPEAENCFACTVNRVVEDVFSTVIMLETPGGTEGRSLLRVEMEKPAWATLSDAKTLYAALSSDNIMLLTDKT